MKITTEKKIKITLSEKELQMLTDILVDYESGVEDDDPAAEEMNFLRDIVSQLKQL